METTRATNGAGGEYMSDEDPMHNSDDSMTSESEGGGRGSPTGSDEEHQETSSSSPETDDEDVGSEEEEEGEDVGKEQDMSFADRVATENRRSRRHKLLHLTRDQSRRAPTETTAQAAGHKRKTEEETQTLIEGAKKTSFRRDNKHRPVEMSSKRRVSVLRDATLGLGDGSGLMKKNRVLDPRFESMAGAYSERAFKKRYSFIFDEKLPEERRELKESLSRVKSDGKRERLQRKLQQITQQIKTEENRRKQESRRDKVLQRHKEATKGQANKFHLKKSDVKKQELVMKYQELQESGGLERYMEKRRKRNAAKDHRYMPTKRETR